MDDKLTDIKKGKLAKEKILPSVMSNIRVNGRSIETFSQILNKNINIRIYKP